MPERSVLAVDLGAESGRVIKASFNGSRIDLKELHRFTNTPVTAAGTIYWDVLRLWHNIKTGIQAGAADALSVGVDTWGVDVTLLDRDGNLVCNPVHYRDKRNDGMMEWAFERVSQREIFERTGIQFMQINGLYGMASLVKNQSPLLDATASMLTIADLFNYWLSGSKTCEYTHVTTTQMFNPRTNDWAHDILQGLGIPTNILTPIVYPGDKIGKYEHLDVIVPGCHDTACAVVGVPTTTSNYAYLSSGTWSLLGLEIDEPVINDAAYHANLTNEGGVYDTIRLLKNITGLWLAQQCRETWMQQGKEYSYAELVQYAEKAKPFQSLVDPDAPDFMAHGDMPARIRAYCHRTGQTQPDSVGEFMRTVYESLAFKYRYVLDLLRTISGKTIDRLHIIGGGTQNELLCQMTANAVGMPVIAGPVEATAMGNAIMQFIAHGDLANLSEARQMLSQSTVTRHYEPRDRLIWEETYERYKTIIQK
jgi:sugar (pentulose or hexulose) kinase